MLPDKRPYVFTQEVQGLIDEVQESIEAMPEQFQEGGNWGADLLIERRDALEEWLSGLEGVDVESEDLEHDDIISEIEACDPGL